jgi:hypothetical protein
MTLGKILLNLNENIISIIIYIEDSGIVKL